MNGKQGIHLNMIEGQDIYLFKIVDLIIYQDKREKLELHLISLVIATVKAVSHEVDLVRY